MTTKRGKDKGSRRRIMRSFKLNEISAVDNPAQQGALVSIMKRADDESQDDVRKRAMLTSEEDGHSHLLVLDFEDGSGARPAGNTMPALTPGADFSHTHPWVMRENGDVVIGMSDGHSHEAGEISVTGSKARELLMEKQETATDGGRRRRRRGNMTTEDAKKAAEKLEAEKEELERKLKTAEAYGKLSDAHKAHYQRLDKAEQEKFLAKSDDERDAIVKAVAKAASEENPVVYKAADGSEYRKNDDPRLVTLAKQSDERLTALEKAQAETADAQYRKRAETELAALPGTIETKVVLLKQVDAISDEKDREEALKALKAHNAKMAPAFKPVGTSEVSKALGEEGSEKDVATAELEKKAREIMKSDPKLSYLDAYEKASDQNPDLLEKAIAG